MKAYDFVRYAEKQILENKMSPDVLCGVAKLSGRLKETAISITISTNVFGKSEISICR